MRLQIAFYSHDTMGLGHMRRNLLIAEALSRYYTQACSLMIAGTWRATHFTLPPGVDCVTLPALRKQENGGYTSRRLPFTLGELIALREKIILSAIKAFDPDIFIVDNVPRGAVRELDPTLAYLQSRRHTRCILGLREVLDESVKVAREWQLAQNEDAIRAYYNTVWVYGDPLVYDPVREYGFSADIAVKVRYTGYLDQRQRLESAANRGEDPLAGLDLPPGRLVLCMVGGGQDGAPLVEAFAQAILPAETNGVILTGPYMPPEIVQDLYRQAAGNPRLRVLTLVPEPALLLNRADRVIAMGGYNTTCEILSSEKPALIVPRVSPRCEQLIRAERLRHLGLLDLLHPDRLSPETLTQWLASDVQPPLHIRDRIDLDGLKRLPVLLEEALGVSSTSFSALSSMKLLSRAYMAL